MAQEARPGWDTVPEKIIAALENILNDKIISGRIAWGGYAPSAAFFATLSSGREAFIKGAHPGDDSHATQTLRQEENAYLAIPGINKISPRFYGTAGDGREDGWLLAVFDKIEAQAAIPWTRDKAEKAFAQLRHVHVQNPPVAGLLPAREKNYVERFLLPEGGWIRLLQDAQRQEKFLTLFADKEEGACWLKTALPVLAAAQRQADQIGGAQGILHQDLRGDNVLFDDKGRCWLIDWPNACTGPVVLDVVLLAGDMCADGLGPAPDLFSLYTHATGISLRQEDILTALAVYSGHLADQAYRAVPAKLPRLRWMQKRLLNGLLGAAVPLLGLPNPRFL